MTAPNRLSIALFASALLTVFGQSREGKASPELLTADTPRVTPGGATFMVPAGWSIVSTANSSTLQPPEPDTHLAIVDVQAADAAAAVASAWAV